MNLSNEFTIPVGVQAAWALLLDVERIVSCVPGAELIERVGDDGYKGRVSVQLGPVALTFDGIAKFTEIDAAARRASLTANGTDRKGRGGAYAKATFHLEPSGASSRVLINTDLQLSGSIAQYGRASGLIAEVAKELIRQFAENLGKEIQKPAPAPDALPTPGGAPPETRAPVKPISGFRLAVRIAAMAITRGFNRLFGRSGGPPQSP